MNGYHPEPVFHAATGPTEEPLPVLADGPIPKEPLHLELIGLQKPPHHDVLVPIALPREPAERRVDVLSGEMGGTGIEGIRHGER